jgi:microcystin-dependent protein
MEAYISMITAFGCNFIIRSWGACKGDLVAISQNQALFSLLGTQFGGDGRTTFGLPDLRGRSPVNHGTGPGLSHVNIGQKGGVETVTLTQAELPAHFHSVNLTGVTAATTADLTVSTDNATSTEPDGNYLGATSGATRPYATTLSTPAGSQTDVVSIPSQAVQVTGNTGNTGANQSTYTRSPYQGVNYQICMFGLFPPRN